MPPLTYLRPGDPPDLFPDPGMSTGEPDGLIAIGGDLDAPRLLAAYRRGIFPWYEAGQPILWWSPDPRAVLLPAELRVSRSLRRRLLRGEYRTSVDGAFARVIAACAGTRVLTGTWITPEMQAAYLQLHELGHAHSVETWQDTELVGGLYGVALGGVFFGESMFSIATDASKVALARLVQLCQERAIGLIDCQVANQHLASLGSRLLPRAEFLARIGALTGGPDSSGPWTARPEGTAGLVAGGPPSHRLHG